MIAKWINHSNNNALGRIQTFNHRILFAQKICFGFGSKPHSSLATEICNKKPLIPNLAPKCKQYR